MKRLLRSCAAILLCVLIGEYGSAQAQVYPPGTFSVDGVPIVCGPITFEYNTELQDVGVNNGQGLIILNPNILRTLPTPLKLFWVAHECGHAFVGSNEVMADCWTIRTGRNQGWFPPQMFQGLIAILQNNPGELAHPNGQARIQNMLACYQSP